MKNGKHVHYSPPGEISGITDYMRGIQTSQGKQTTKYNTTIIKPPSEDYLIQFLGGPVNAEQRFYKRKDYPAIQNGAIWSIRLMMPLAEFNFDGDNLSVKESTEEYASYKLIFLPPEETPFSEAQVILGIFQ